MMPAGQTDACSTHPAALVPRSDRERLGVTKPKVLSEVKPIYPKSELDAKSELAVLFEGEITEHGTLVNVHHLEPVGASDDFKLASQLAASLWRFEPALVEACRARTIATFEMSYAVK
ncbi:MAG TPA: hypothetical protein VNZ26_05150, partial [Vicinamibacterales bacterium]|nr:hypothetical protein [Vicinamibacterales bacterium]